MIWITSVSDARYPTVSEGVLGERPVEALLRHAERKDHIHCVMVLGRDRGEVVQGVGTSLLVGVVHEVGDAHDLAGLSASDADDPRVRVGEFHVADRVDDEADPLDLVLGGLAVAYRITRPGEKILSDNAISSRSASRCSSGSVQGARQAQQR